MGINLKSSNKMGVDFSQLSNDLKEKIYKGLSDNTMGLVNVTGDSMEPSIKNGGMVLMDSSNIVIENDYAYVFRKKGELLYEGYNEDCFCKRLSLNEKGELSIISENGTYAPFYFDNLNEIEVMGKVVATIRPNSNVLKEVTNQYEIMYPIPIARNWDDVEKIMKKSKEIEDTQRN